MPRNWATGSGVSPQTVAESLLLLKTVVPTLTLSPEVAGHFLQDMTDTELRESVVLIVQHVVDLYPSTNWIALLRTARQKWCSLCQGTGRYDSITGYETKCVCRQRRREEDV